MAILPISGVQYLSFFILSIINVPMNDMIKLFFLSTACICLSLFSSTFFAYQAKVSKNLQETEIIFITTYCLLWFRKKNNPKKS